MKITVLPEAQGDINDAIHWYSRESSALATRFFAEVERTVERIAANPLHFPAVRGDRRRAVVKIFPYIVIFVVQEDEIFVSAVLHGHRKPSTWQKRKLPPQK